MTIKYLDSKRIVLDTSVTFEDDDFAGWTVQSRASVTAGVLFTPDSNYANAHITHSFKTYAIGEPDKFVFNWDWKFSGLKLPFVAITSEASAGQASSSNAGGYGNPTEGNKKIIFKNNDQTMSLNFRSYKTGGSNFNEDDDSSTATTTNGTMYYYQFIKDGYNISWKRYGSIADRTAQTNAQQTVTTTWNAGSTTGGWTDTADLAYIVIGSYGNYQNVGFANAGSNYTYDFKFYSGVTTPPAKPTNVENNSILVEKNIGSRYWFDTDAEIATASTGTYAVDLPVGSYDNDKQGFCVANTSSAVYGKTINSVSFWLKRGSSTTGTAYVRVWSGTGNGNAGTQVHEFGSIALSALTTSFVKHTFSTGSHTLAVNDTVGVEFTGGSSSTSPVLQGATTDVYDGVNTIRNRNTTGGTFSPVTSHDVKFEITEIIPTWTMNPTFEDDFSSDNWTDADSTNIGVADGVLHAIGARDTTNDTSYIDLGSPLSDTKWVMRFKANMTTATAGSSGSSNIIYLALSDSSGARSVAQDSINFGWEIWSAGNTIGIIGNEASAQDYISSGTSIASCAVRLDYFEVIRNSATLVTVNQYSDSAYSTLVNSITRAVTSATGGLRYLKCNNLDDSSTEDSDIIVDIDDIEIYDGVTTIN